ncbi:MAG TPA: M56 family metallopeptidase [Steroidobacteraceae bacterium]|nr:M56 family metallopeptidase [Steroidobacteraceae bacterium]
MTNPETVRILGWCLLHFVWQGAVLALVLCALLARIRSPQARYASAVCALTAMMIAPFATYALLQQSPPPIGQVSLGGIAQIRGGLEAVQAMVAAPDVRPSSTVAKAASIDWMSYAVLAWLAGVYMFTLRTLGAWMLLIRMRRQRAEAIAGDLLQTCLALQRRLGVSRAVRFVCSKAAESPAVLGWWRPVVVLPLSALAGLSPWQVEAIIAHELAHIKRWDGLVNVFQIATETLLFYHPAVWWVNRVIRNEREHCCDDVAVSACGNAPGYARALALLEESRSSSVWAMAANGGVLTSRIGRLLGIKGVTSAISTSGLVFIGSLCVAGILMAGTASTRITSDLPPPTPPDPPGLLSDPPAAPADPPTAPEAPAALLAPEPPSVPSIPAAPRVHLSRISPVAPVAAPKAPSTPKAPATVKAPSAPTADSGEGGSYIGGLQSAGLKDLTVEEIIALKIHGVTPGYIREMRAAGLEASPRELVALKVQDVTPEFVNGLAAAGLTNLHIHDYLSAKVQGITPEFAQKIRSHGFKDLTIHQLISLKVAGIS